MPGAPQAIGETERAAVAARRGKVASGIKDPQERKRFISRQGEEEERSMKGKSEASLEKISAEGELEAGRQLAGGESGDTTRTLRSYKHGGVVKKTGAALLHKGEKVLTKSEADGEGEVHEVRARRAGKGFIVTNHRKARKKADGGMEMAPEPTEHVVSDIQGLHDHVQEHLGGGEEALSE